MVCQSQFVVLQTRQMTFLPGALLLTSFGDALSLHETGVDADSGSGADDGNEGDQCELHFEYVCVLFT